MAFGNPPAFMGYIGFVRFEFPSDQIVVRANSADVRLSQEISRPEVIDGRWDKTVYQLGPKLVEGGVEYPAIMERLGRSDPAARLYQAAIGREQSGTRAGRLKASNIFNLGVKYTSAQSEFRYKDCVVNSWRFSAAQSDVVTIGVDLIGRTRENANISPLNSSSNGYPSNARIVTWNDVVVEVLGQRGAPNIDGAYIRNFEANIENNVERYYSFNGSLFPQDIAARKRDISGSMTLMGRHEQLGEHARTNDERCYEDSQIKFGYKLTRDECNSTFLVTLPNIVFEIEELALTNDIFETTVNWHCLPDELVLDASPYLVTGGAVS